MILDLINHIFVETGMRWRIGDVRLTPTEANIKDALDEAARHLYTTEVGDSITVENIGLHVVKTQTGYQVYALIGEYT